MCNECNEHRLRAMWVPARKVLKVYFCGSFRPELSKLSADYFCITLFADRGGECACAVPVLPIHVHVHVQREMRPLDWSCLCFALGPPKVWPIMRPYSPLHMRMETGNSSHQPTAKRFWQSSGLLSKRHQNRRTDDMRHSTTRACFASCVVDSQGEGMGGSPSASPRHERRTAQTHRVSPGGGVPCRRVIASGAKRSQFNTLR